MTISIAAKFYQNFMNFTNKNPISLQTFDKFNLKFL